MVMKVDSLSKGSGKKPSDRQEAGDKEGKGKGDTFCPIYYCTVHGAVRLENFLHLIHGNDDASGVCGSGAVSFHVQAGSKGARARLEISFSIMLVSTHNESTYVD